MGRKAKIKQLRKCLKKSITNTKKLYKTPLGLASGRQIHNALKKSLKKSLCSPQ